ncbi:hypothetical protein MCOR30_000721 [Pyricularia oryzae]|nr:hypothetical protein MCOR30_000721 [Pyricularia oryzae]KAI6497077.1 hypothetical protein MCOR11_004660 [Pyricularia oryzae]
MALFSKDGERLKVVDQDQDLDLDLDQGRDPDPDPGLDLKQDHQGNKGLEEDPERGPDFQGHQEEEGRHQVDYGNPEGLSHQGETLHRLTRLIARQIAHRHRQS